MAAPWCHARGADTLLVLALHVLAFPAAADTLARVKAARAINVAYSPDSIPFSFTDKAGPAGYSIDICKRVIAQVGRRVGYPNLKVNWLPAQTAERLKMVASGKADLECGNTTQTLARMANVDFSSLVFLEIGGLVGRVDAKVEHLGDMGGRKIVVLKGTTTEARLREALQAKLINAEVVGVNDAAEGVAKLEAGEADVMRAIASSCWGSSARRRTRRASSSSTTRSRTSRTRSPCRATTPPSASRSTARCRRCTGGEIVTIYTAWLGSLGQPPDLIKAMYVLQAIPD